MHHHSYYIYIVTNFTKTVLYTGVTNNLEQRIIEHYLGRVNTKIFTGKYNAFYLIYYESFKYINDAIAREKEIKGRKREKKIALIKSFNADVKFLNNELFDSWPSPRVISQERFIVIKVLPEIEADMDASYLSMTSKRICFQQLYKCSSAFSRAQK